MKIKWSSFALNAMFNTLDYVEEHFGRTARNNLMSSINHTKTLLRKQPLIGQIEQLLDDSLIQYRSILVSDVNRIVYYVDKKYIIFVDFWDMRRDPDFLAKRISNY